jgi:N-acetylmuramoyl-L-alanine amidase
MISAPRLRWAPLLIAIAALLAPITSPASAALRPPMEQQQLAFWPERVAKTRNWSMYMHGTTSFQPRLLVEHWTQSNTQDAAIDFWNSSAESTWVHFIIDQQGRITQLAPVDALAKHAFGVSPWAIGIEHVGTSDREVLSNRRMLAASFRLTCWLQERLRIPLRGVIGHGEVTSHPRFGFTPEGWAWIESTGYQFHGDFSSQTMRVYRDRLQEVCFSLSDEPVSSALDLGR